jgi:hypothetical protein
MTFTVDVHQNEDLPEGAGEMHAVITVTSEGGRTPSATAEKAVVLVVDTSGSMEHPGTKIRAARTAAARAIELLPKGTLFALVAGTHKAQVVYPSTGHGLARADARTRADAVAATRRLRAEGGTAMSTWLDCARRLLEPHDGAIRLAYLMTDGKNESERPELLDVAISRAAGIVQCHARGVGEDWVVTELRKISAALLGDLDIIAEPNEMERDFQRFMDRAIGKDIADVWLRVWSPNGASLRFIRQVAPTIDDLTGRGTPAAPLATDYPTGAWAGKESRDYHLCVDLSPAEVGEEKLAARVSLVVGEQVAGQGLIRAVWTDDLARSTRINRRVAAYTGQTQMAHDIECGVAAFEAGDHETARLRLGRAVLQATATGNDPTLKLLRNVVDIDDAPTGRVRLKPEVERRALMTLATRSDRTVRLGAAKVPPASGKDGPGQ